MVRIRSESQGGAVAGKAGHASYSLPFDAGRGFTAKGLDVQQEKGGWSSPSRPWCQDKRGAAPTVWSLHNHPGHRKDVGDACRPRKH